MTPEERSTRNKRIADAADLITESMTLGQLSAVLQSLEVLNVQAAISSDKGYCTLLCISNTDDGLGFGNTLAAALSSSLRFSVASGAK